MSLRQELGLVAAKDDRIAGVAFFRTSLPPPSGLELNFNKSPGAPIRVLRTGGTPGDARSF
jgi:hypothetical protein